MKVHNYNIEKYPFKILLEDLLECKLEKIHEKFKVGSEEIVGKVYEYFRTSKDFKLIWESFCEDVVKGILKDTKIVVQQLPSVKIISPPSFGAVSIGCQSFIRNSHPQTRG